MLAGHAPRGWVRGHPLIKDSGQLKGGGGAELWTQRHRYERRNVWRMLVREKLTKGAEEGGEGAPSQKPKEALCWQPQNLLDSVPPGKRAWSCTSGRG